MRRTFTRKSLPALAAFVVAFAVAGCSAKQENNNTEKSGATTSSSSLVLAEDRLGEITLADVDAYVLELSADRRWQAATDPVERYGALTRRVAVDRLLHDEAVLVGADQDAEFQLLERRTLRNVYSEHYLNELEAGAPITEEELRAYYDDNGERFESEERREILHVFKRLDPGDDREVLRAEMAAVRERALAGESFEVLARQQSDSETRHDGGRLGFVPRGRFPADFDRVVFALEKQVPSETVFTKDGAHVFYVAAVLDARSFLFEEVRQLIFQEMSVARRAERLVTATADLPLPEESFVGTRQETHRRLRSGNPNVVVLRLGDFRLSAGQLMEQVAALRRMLGGNADPDLPLRMLDEVRHREVIYQYLQREGLPEIPREAIDRERRRQLVEYYGRRRMATFVEGQPERLQAHYDNNVMRFSTPVKVQLQRLAVSHEPKTAPAVMARLENARADLDAATTTLEDLAAKLGGEVHDLGLVTSVQLRTVDPRALQFAFLLKVGEHSPPYQLGQFLVMFRVDGREEPVARPLPLVRERVVQDVVNNNGPAVFGDLSESLLAEAGFELYEERLATIGPIVAR